MDKLCKDSRNNGSVSDNTSTLETPLSQNTKVRALEKLFYAGNENSTKPAVQHNPIYVIF